jgi:predicted nucleotidyltransferase component of viral defense system
MAFNEVYRQQVALLMRILPLAAQEKEFALKGGTAINLFVRDMPRLSVDIDLMYLPVKSRPESLKAIDAALQNIAKRVTASIQGAQVHQAKREGLTTKLTIRAAGVQTIIEVTPVLRGSVYPPKLLSVSKPVQDEFGFAEIQVVSFADLYAGKIVAALDRQHPRDLFDVRELLAKEGISDDLRRAFVVYMLSHDRPMFEVLATTRKDITQLFQQAFQGMTREPVAQAELEKAREALIVDIVGKMPDDHRRFMVSFEKGKPEWQLLNVDGADKLPAVLWRQQNLDTLDEKRRGALVANLAKVLNVSA